MYSPIGGRPVRKTWSSPSATGGLATTGVVFAASFEARAPAIHSSLFEIVAIAPRTSETGVPDANHSTSIAGRDALSLATRTRRPALLLKAPAAPSGPVFQKSAPCATSPVLV